MSTFVEIAPDEYDPAAFKDFEPSAAGFKIANARAACLRDASGANDRSGLPSMGF